MATRKEDPSNGAIINFAKRFVDKDKGSVRIRTRERANGNFVVYLDIYEVGKRRTVVICGDNNEPLYLWPEKRGDREAREHNNEVWETAVIAKSKYISQGQTSTSRKRKKKGDLFLFLDNIIAEEEARAKELDTVGSLWQWKALRNHLHACFGDGPISWESVDKDFVTKFLDYLRTWEGVKGKLGQTTIRQRAMRLKQLLKKATESEEGYLAANPFTKKIERAKTEEVCYLTEEEIRLIMGTSTKREIVKQGFLFACFTGLRLSDIIRLRWSDITDDDVLGPSLSIIVKKTRRSLQIPIPAPAQQILKELGEHEEDGLVFNNFGTPNTVGYQLQKMATAAGINKKVRFHVARHSCATLLLSYNVPLPTVQEILGHADISTTQIYAKVLDKSKKSAADALSEAFK